MKIIRLTTFLDFGGIERKMENLSSWIDEHEWIFVALNKGGAASEAIKANNKKVICLGLNYKIPGFKTIFALYKFFKKEKPQVVHCAGAEANFHGIIAAWLANVPIEIAEEIGISSHSKLARFIFSYIFKIADYVTCESEAVVKNLNDKYHLPQHKVVKIFNFIKEGQDTPPIQKEEKSGFTIMSVSRLEPVKNIELALSVIKRLVDDQVDVKYVIVGDGILREKLFQLAKDLKIEANVEFLGYQSNPQRLLKMADLFLLTSNHEGFSNSLLEAMYGGVASVSTKVGGAQDMIVDGINGWLVNVNKEDELYHKLLYVISLPKEELLKVASAGRETVINGFTLKSHMELTYKIYQER